MIKINRGDCPESLNSANRNLVENDYKKDDVISSLWAMQNQKCCYCEKSLTELGKSERWVEHFIPRTDNSFKIAGATDWNRANAWTNLLYTCATCNRTKGTESPFAENGERRLIDPSFLGIDPEDHIDFYVNECIIVYMAKDNSILGETSLRNLKLKKRTDIYIFLRRNMTKIDAIFTNLVDYLINDQDLFVSSNKLELSRMTSSHLPHAGFCRNYIAKRLDKFNTLVIPVINLQHQKSINPINLEIGKETQVIL